MHSEYTTSFRARFWSKVQRSPTGCWEWTRYRDRKGYGRFNVNNTPRLAHRVAWEVTYGAVPDGMCVLHRCDNPPCVNPDHLWLGVVADNQRDMARKGRVGGALFNATQVQEIRAQCDGRRGTLSRLARTYGTSRTVIWKIAHRLTYVEVV